jgi:hypothetical protein
MQKGDSFYDVHIARGNFFVDHAHVWVSHAHFRSRLLLASSPSLLTGQPPESV